MSRSPRNSTAHTQSRKGRAALISLVEAAVSHAFAEELGDYANTKELDILVPLHTLLRHRSKHHGLATARAAAVYALHSAGLHYRFIAQHYGLSEGGVCGNAHRFALRLKRDVWLTMRMHAVLDAVTVALVSPVPQQSANV